MNRIIILITAAILLIPARLLPADRQNYQKASLILFPETSSWMEVSKLKHPEKEFLQKILPELKKAYLERFTAPSGIPHGCDISERLFSEQERLLESFYEFDLNSDGINDIFYTGSSLCDDRYMTVFWYGSKEGYKVRQTSELYTLTIRIKAGEALLFTSVMPGCCDNFVDEYISGTILNTRKYGSKKVFTGMEFPAGIISPVSFSVEGEMILRKAPIINDTYNEAESSINNMAVFGNILSRYMKGSSGVILSSQKDKENRQWHFVLIDEEKGKFRTHAPYKVNAGWITSEGIWVK